MPITKTAIDSMEPGAVIWDDGRGSVVGFGVRRQRKHPSFVLKYSVGSRQRWFTIGKYGSPWTVEQARVEAKRLLGMIAAGVDPAVARDAPPPMTVAELCDRYMVAAEAGAVLTRFNRPKKASTLEIDKGRISRHIKPLIGTRAVTDIDKKAVARLINDITVGKTAVTVKTKSRGRAKVTGGAGTAARVADLLSGIMTWAMDEGAIERNPVHRVRRYRGEAKQRFLSDEELQALGKTLAEGKDAAGKAFHPYAVTILKLLCLTGCRIGEVAGLRWAELDVDMSCLRLADTKTGRSLRAIGGAALDILKSQPRIAGDPFVFPATRGGGGYYLGVRKEVPRIFATAAISAATAHTLRHTFASVASGLGYSDGTIAGLLGHRGRGVTSRYIHRPDQALASAAEVVSAAIAASLDKPTRASETTDNKPYEADG